MKSSGHRYAGSRRGGGALALCPACGGLWDGSTCSHCGKTAAHKFGAKPMRCCPQCTHHWPAVKGGDPRCQACGYEKSIRFGSTREMKRYIELRMELQLGRIHSLVLQPRFPFPPGFTYVADFTYVDATGSQVVEDTKGAITEAFGLKRKCFKYFYPTLDLRVLK